GCRWSALDPCWGDTALVEAVLKLLPAEVGSKRAKAVEAVLATQPQQAEIRAAREARYRESEMWEPLGHLLAESAKQEKVPQQAAARLREAAGIFKSKLF